MNLFTFHCTYSTLVWPCPAQLYYVIIATNNIYELRKDLITQICYRKLYVPIGLDIIFYIAFCHERSGVILTVECTTYIV